ncbi:hypothetical protein DRQ36_10465 [bacterium]|nr:MAG: hypothetical protein DRQ36_10465 [bacterium]
MHVKVFNIRAVNPPDDELAELNEKLDKLSPERTWMEIVETPDGPVWSIILLLETEHHHKKPEPLPPLDPFDEEIYEALLDWRHHLAQKENLPEYFIMHNRTLREIALIRPSNMDELKEIHGIGEWKAKTYGEGILKVIAAIVQSQEGNEEG